MIPRQNLHTHTNFDDGKNTPVEMAQAALDAGLESLGFSGHSTVPYENDWTLQDIPAYLAAVKAAQARFEGRLTIYNGLEFDLTSRQELSGFDYIIGSIHHIDIGDDYPSIDDTAEIADDILCDYFHCDKNAMLQAYFEQYDLLARHPAVDIVGHFDLITKFNRFDESSTFYRDCAMAALETLVRADKIFEVNTGAMARGYRSVPYPAPFFLRELKAHRARVLITSDAHSTGAITYAFRGTAELLQSIGFTELWEYAAGGFRPVRLG